MDKVLVHRGVTTLDVLVIGLVASSSSRACSMPAHLCLQPHHQPHRCRTRRAAVPPSGALPLAYFQARRVGDSVARVRELENIRSFLTGNALTLVLDVLFSIIFIAVMLFYSVPLTLIVLASLPLYLVLSLAWCPSCAAG